MNSRRTKSLFKKAYYHNWDNGLGPLTKIINDKDCDKGTALMIFWHGKPNYFYNTKSVDSLEEYEKPTYKMLKAIEKKVANNEFESIVSYEIEETSRLKKFGNIPIELTKPVKGKFKYEDVLWPNNNSFQEEILEICQSCESTEAFYDLEEKGADFTKKILNGYATPIEVAVGNGNTKALKYFIEKKFDLNKKYNKNPLLCTAIRTGSLEMLELMIQNGAKVNKKGGFGRTALHNIAGWEDADKIKEVATFLISAGADPNILDSDKKSPLDLAKMRENTPFIKFISNAKY